MDKETTSFERSRNNIEKGNSTDKTAELSQEHLDVLRLFNQVFNNKNGKKIIEHLDKRSHDIFPHYDNVNFTFSKIGEQELVKYIKEMVRISINKK